MIDEHDPPFPPAFRHSFLPGELIVNAGFHRFERYLPRQHGEADEAYARRLEHSGLAMVMTSEEVRDPEAFRRVKAEATNRESPVMILTISAPEHLRNETPEEREAAKAAALAAARSR